MSGGEEEEEEEDENENEKLQPHGGGIPVMG